MQRLASWLSVSLVVGVALAAFVTAVFPRGKVAPREHDPASAVPSGEPRDDRLFDGDGYSFVYPGAWARSRERATEAGRLTTAFAWRAPTAISPSTSGEALVLVIEPLRESLGEAKFDPYLRLMRTRLRYEGEGLLERPSRITVAGLPALRSAVEFPDGAVRRYTVVLHRRRAYSLTCTFLSERMERGCDQVETSFSVE